LIAAIAVVVAIVAAYFVVSTLRDRERLTVSPLKPSAVQPAKLELSTNVIGQREDPDGNVSEVLVNEGAELQSHDNLQIHFTTNKDAYVYVLIFDSKHNVELLFPDPKIKLANNVKSGVEYTVPSPNEWFWLDENAGTETLYVLASETPLEDIQSLIKGMKTAGVRQKQELSEQVQEKVRSLERGIGGISAGRTKGFRLKDGKVIQNVTTIVQGTGAVVRAVSFRHIDNRPPIEGAKTMAR
jgi:hypothetical protein